MKVVNGLKAVERGEEYNVGSVKSPCQYDQYRQRKEAYPIVLLCLYMLHIDKVCGFWL